MLGPCFLSYYGHWFETRQSDWTEVVWAPGYRETPLAGSSRALLGSCVSFCVWVLVSFWRRRSGWLGRRNPSAGSRPPARKRPSVSPRSDDLRRIWSRTAPGPVAGEAKREKVTVKDKYPNILQSKKTCCYLATFFFELSRALLFLEKGANAKEV